MIPKSITNIIDQLRTAANEAKLSSKVRRAIASAVRRAMLPRRSKKRNWLDDAYDDYKGGIRGVQLYRKHIPDLDKLGRWPRERAQRRLRQALAKRAERERKRAEDARAEGLVSPMTG